MNNEEKIEELQRKLETIADKFGETARVFNKANGRYIKQFNEMKSL